MLSRNVTARVSGKNAIPKAPNFSYKGKVQAPGLCHDSRTLSSCLKFTSLSRQVEQLGCFVSTYRLSSSRSKRIHTTQRSLSSNIFEPKPESMDISISEIGQPRASSAGQKDIEIQPSYPEKPKAVQNLVKGLKEILSASNTELSSPQSFSARSWYLDGTGRAIHRHYELQSKDQAETAQRIIKTAADEINHHPHILIDGLQLTVTCATHNPPGLSVKDVKLAKKIDELLHATSESFEERTISEVAAETIHTARNKARQKNMADVIQAQDDCGCSG